MPLVIGLLLLGIVGLNIYATAIVARSYYYDRGQKIVQYFFIWLLPAVGATLCWAIARSTEPPRVTTDLTDRPESQPDLYTRVQTGVEDFGGHDGGSN